MDVRAVEKARKRFRSAYQAIDRMKLSKSFDDFSVDWCNFLYSWKAIYTALEQGAKISEGSKKWFCEKKKERLDIYLLNYLFQARNDEEHGLDCSLMEDAESYLWEFEKTCSGGEAVELRVNPVTGEKYAWCAENPMKLVQRTNGPTLTAVKDSKGRIWAAPIGFKNKPCDMTPIGVAEVALEYIENVIREAKELSST